MIFRGTEQFSGVLVRDSARGSVIVTVPARTFLAAPLAEGRSFGLVREVPTSPDEDDVAMAVDRLVTCVMVVWAVSIFVGMSYLAAII